MTVGYPSDAWTIASAAALAAWVLTSLAYALRA